MKVALVGFIPLILFLFTGWGWLLIVGFSIMIIGLMFSYSPPQDDPVWKKLVDDEVIDKDNG